MRSHINWWQETTIYQIYPRSFQDSNGDGVGDIPGIIRRLDYLASLGVGTLWLSPVFTSPDDDNGYDVADYTGIQPAFGTLAEFDELLVGAHARGMRLVLDLVANHSSDEHAWFRESASAKTSPKRDWYVWRPPAPDGGPPNNWPSFFSGPAWTLDERTGEYYLHLFSRKQPDLNWEHPDVREAMYAAMRFWLDRGVDGFRMDVITLISKAPGLPSAPAGMSFEEIATRYYANGPAVHAYLREMRARVLQHYDCMALAEGFGITARNLGDYTEPARRQLDLAYHFDTLALTFAEGANRYGSHQRLRLPELREILRRWDNGLASGGWLAQTLGNHDYARMTSRFGSRDPRYRARSSKLLLTLLACLRGTPCFYQGDELGMLNPPLTNSAQIDDIEARNHYAERALSLDAEGRAALLDTIAAEGRDNARHPMQWDDSPQAGFTTGEPWLRVHPDYPQLNAAAQENDPTSVLNYFRTLLRFRKTSDALLAGDFELAGEDPEILLFRRGAGLWCVFNLSDGERALPERLRGLALLLENLGDGQPRGEALAPWEARILGTPPR